MSILTNEEEKVLKKIKKQPQTINGLSESLGMSSTKIKEILSKLKQELLIKEENNRLFYTIDDSHEVGLLKITKRNIGIVKTAEGKTYFVEEEYLNNAVDGDTVLVKINNPLSTSAIIIDKKEAERKVVGTIIIRNNKYFIQADNPALKANLKLVNPTKDLNANDKVFVSFISSKNTTSYKIKEIEVLGNKFDVGVDITSIIKELGIEEEFSKEELVAAKELENYVDSEDLKERVNLCAENIFTIDGKDSSDFDDAIGITALDNNHLLVKVCIADVDYYVYENSILDQTAKRRTSSIYLLDRTIHMLPTKLSNGICSLNPNENRLTLTYEMEYDVEGNLVRYTIYPSIIRSKQRMNYEDVEDVLNNPTSQQYPEYQNDLRLLDALRKKIRAKRMASGHNSYADEYRMIDYDTEHGKIKDIFKMKNLSSRLLIEEYMIAANVCASSFAKEHNIPIIYRVQDEDSRDQMKLKLDILEKMGFKKFDFKEEMSNSEIIREVLSYYKDDPNLPFIRRVINNNNRAYYTDEKTYHSSLNENVYAHFTSPIRRYPDLYSSRQIKKYLKGKKKETNTIEDILQHINLKNSDIKICSKRTEGLKLGEYYEEKREVMPATIISINQKFITFQLEDLTTGVIFKNNLPGYYFNDEDYCFQRKNFKLKVGDTIHVKIKNTDKYNGLINYNIYTK